MTFTLAVLGAVLFLLLVLLSLGLGLQARIKTYENEHVENEWTRIKPGADLVVKCLFIASLLMLGAFALTAWSSVRGTPTEGHIMEWMNLIVRWAHITFGIAWVGASFYFVFLENSLNRTYNLRDELAGNMWAVHGGGFYYIEKFKVKPPQIPKDLHWFKYEAYFTWMSGFILLCVVYYFNAEGFLIDPNVMKLTATEAIVLSLGSLALSWAVYDFLCSTKLLKKGMLFAIIGFALMVGVAWFYTHVFSARAAYIHVGAVIGTIMAGNVFFGIIPAQKAMVKAATEGSYLDPSLGKNAGLRSMHNNYFTLPVLFIMISNHFPSTFGYEHNWAVLAAISLGSAGLKHFLNLLERREYSIWIMPVSVLMIIGVAFTTAPDVGGECKSQVTMADVYPIITERCMSCHSSQPTDPDWASPPNGVAYDTPEAIARLKDKIMQRVVITKTMPQNNKTGMLPEERELIRCWIEQGAPVN